MQTGRDALAAHALQLDDAELQLRCPGYVSAPAPSLDTALQAVWRQDSHLGDPDRPRLVTIYPGLATAGVGAPIPTTAVAQENLIRATGLATFLRQVRILIDPVQPGSTLDGLLAEVMLNDYLDLWELLFTPGVVNEHGMPDVCVLDHWLADGWRGAGCLARLRRNPHPDASRWREEIRNKFTAHVDPEADIAERDVAAWPVTVDELIIEVGRVIEALAACSRRDVRSKYLFAPPTVFGPEVIGLAAQEGKR